MRKREVQAGRENKVIFLRSCRWVGNVDIAKLVLPAKPFADLRDRSQAESSAILPALLQIRKEAQALREYSALAKLGVQFLAQGQGDKSVRHSIGSERRRRTCGEQRAV